MRLMLYCDDCLQSCTEKGKPYVPADYFEDGEICPYCQNGHLFALFPDEVESFRQRKAAALSSERRAEILAFMTRVYDRYEDKADADQIISALRAA